MRSLLRALACTLLVLAGRALSGQSVNTCETRNIVVNVRDKSGKLIVGLPPEAFHVTLHNQTLKVLSSKVEIAPPRVVLVIDASLSMTSTGGKWGYANLAAMEVAKSPGLGGLALVVFADGILETMDFTHTPQQVLLRLAQLSDREKIAPRGEGRTALIDAILYAVTLLATRMPGDAIYAITDGGDNVSRASWGGVRRALIANGTRLFAFILENKYFPGLDEERIGREYTSDVVQDTGGWKIVFDANPGGRVPFDASSGERAPEGLPQVADQIAYFYQLKVALPSSLEKPERWNIEVVDDHSQKRKDLTVYFPRELAPCGAGTTKR